VWNLTVPAMRGQKSANTLKKDFITGKWNGMTAAAFCIPLTHARQARLKILY